MPFPTFSWGRKDGSGCKTLPSCGCRPKSWELFLLLHSPPLECILFFYSTSSTKNPLGNLAQRLSWQPQRGVRHYQGAQIFFLSATWGFKMLSISCNKFPRLPSPILRLPMSVIYAYAGVEYIHSHAMLFFLLFSNDDWKTPTEAWSSLGVNNQKFWFFFLRLMQFDLTILIGIFCLFVCVFWSKKGDDALEFSVSFHLTRFLSC